MVEIKSISKKFRTDFWKKEVHALSDVSFEVKPGSIFGLIGHNGAGKTTLIKILMGLIKPTGGQALIMGKSCQDPGAKTLLGYLPEAAYYYEFLRADEILRFYAGLFGLAGREAERRIDALLELVGLSHRRDLKLRYFSKGMLQRIGIAQALINDPSLVIMDEPMSGLDPMGRKEVRDIILDLRKKNKTILFSTHILPDVEAFCDDVAILVKGRLQATGALSDMVEAKTKSVDVVFKGGHQAPWPEGFSFSKEPRVVGDTVTLALSSAEQVNELVQYGISQNLQLVSVSSHRESLEDIFVEMSDARRS